MLHKLRTRCGKDGLQTESPVHTKIFKIWGSLARATLSHECLSLSWLQVCYSVPGAFLLVSWCRTVKTVVLMIRARGLLSVQVFGAQEDTWSALRL